MLALATALLLAASVGANAQSAFGGIETDLPDVDLPNLNQYAPALPDGTDAFDQREIRMEARLSEDSDVLTHGLVWRVFETVPGDDGRLPLAATAEGGAAQFQLRPGDYYIHCAFGLAAVTRKLTIPAQGVVENQSLVLDAGGLSLSALSGDDGRIPPEDLSFAIYAATPDANGERGLIVADVKPNTIVRLNAGRYHVVSDYGALNASVRSDIYIEPGKLTEATIQHRAAQLTLKLVANEGGEAIADTAWSVLTASGDPISETVGAFPSLVLAEGNYTAIARNKDRVYQRDFTVTAGVNTDIEVLLTQ
jgi:hypothetical protein